MGVQEFKERTIKQLNDEIAALKRKNVRLRITSIDQTEVIQGLRERVSDLQKNNKPYNR